MGGSVVDFVSTMGQIREDQLLSDQECEMDCPMFVVRAIFVAVLGSNRQQLQDENFHPSAPSANEEDLFSYAHTNVEQDAR
jgi:hypothetical protein